MSWPLRILVAALVWSSGTLAQSAIEIGKLDPAPRKAPKGYRTCVPSQAHPTCGLVFGYSVVGPSSIVVLSEFKRTLDSGRSEFTVVDVMAVPDEFQTTLRMHCRYRGVLDYALLAAVEFAGEPDVWVGPVKWAVGVDSGSKKIVPRDPTLVECYFARQVE